jgi:hypothetical protein
MSNENTDEIENANCRRLCIEIGKLCEGNPVKHVMHAMINLMAIVAHDSTNPLEVIEDVDKLMRKYVRLIKEKEENPDE